MRWQDPIRRRRAARAREEQQAEPVRIPSRIEVDRPPEQVRHRPHVAAGGGPLPRCREPVGRTIGKRSRVVVGRPELDPVAIGALQVVPDDLVQLDEVVAVLVHPRRETLVELRTRRLRKRVVGRVADKQMTEAEGVLTGKLRPVRSQQLSAYERRERHHELGLVR